MPDERRSLFVGKKRSGSTVLCASAAEVNRKGAGRCAAIGEGIGSSSGSPLGSPSQRSSPLSRRRARNRFQTGVHGHPDNRGVGSYSVFVPGVTDFPSSSAVSTSSNQIELVRVEQPRSTPSDNAFATGIRSRSCSALPRATPSDKIEFVRTQPRSIGEPQVVAAGFDWKDAGIGAGLALALVLLGVGAALASRHVGRAQTA